MNRNRWIRRVRSAVLLSALLGLAAATVTHGRWWKLPDRHNPWAPLAVADAPGWLTRHKLNRLSNDPALCHAVLRDAGATATPVPDRDTGSGCGWSDAVQLRGGVAIDLATPVVLSCRSAVSFALWERHVVQPAAAQHLGRPVRRIEHFGSFACRNVNHAAGGQRSRHARAEALDVAGFVLEGGTRISVLRNWPRGDTPAQFLRAVHGGACRWFDGVLGPDHNRQHADHLHFERGPWRVCR